MTPAVRSAWAARTVAEYRSAAVASEMLHWTLVIGVSPDLIDGLHRLVRDEIDHADLSREVLEAAGGGREAATISRDALHLRVWPNETLERRALAAALHEFAFHETVALEQFRAMDAGPLVPVVRAAIGRILRDEARHRRLGWQLVAELMERTGERDRLATLVTPAIEGVLASYRGSHASSVPEWGLLDVATRDAAVQRAVRGPIARNLRRLGLQPA